MAIILIDYQDCYNRADRIRDMGTQCCDYADALSSEEKTKPLSEALKLLGQDLSVLSNDIRTETDSWVSYYENNHHPSWQEGV